MMRAMNKATIIALLAIGGFALGCKDSKDSKDSKSAQQPAAGKAADDPGKAPEPAANPVAKQAKLVALSLPKWGVEILAAEGAKIGESEDDEPLTIVGACGEEELELLRHGKDALEEMFKNSTSLTEFNSKYLIKEKTETGFKIKRSWTPPLGETFQGEAGVVVGDHLFLCGIGDMFGVDEALADCAIAACTSIKASAK